MQAQGGKDLLDRAERFQRLSSFAFGTVFFSFSEGLISDNKEGLVHGLFLLGNASESVGSAMFGWGKDGGPFLFLRNANRRVFFFFV